MTIAPSASPTFLVLHGGGGPQTVASLAAHLATTARVLAPTLPGWDGTPRPPALDSIAAFAEAYLRQLEALALTEVVVVGSSIGGWLGAELALRDTARRIAALVIVNGVGVEVPGHPVRNLTGLAPHEIAAISFHDPATFAALAPPPTPERLAIMRANQAAFAVVAGQPYGCDPTLRARLGELRVPTLVVWGASDGVVSTAYGRAYAAAIPGARFALVAEAGHLPHLEQPAATFGAIDGFVAELAARAA